MRRANGSAMIASAKREQAIQSVWAFTITPEEHHPLG